MKGVVSQFAVFAIAACHALASGLRRCTGIVTHRRAAGWAFVAVAVTFASDAVAQLAPTGDFYAARTTDTGFAGKVNAGGGYAASVPLDLPAPRGGIPQPVAVTFGGHDLGAAGVGWDVPLSFVRVDTSFTKRKPQNVPNSPAQGRMRVSLSLAGQSMTLVRDGTQWVAQQDNGLYRAVASGATWLVTDGSGHTFTFTEPAGHAGLGFFLLTQVAGPTGTLMTLRYEVSNVALTGGTGMAIDLASVAYNFQPALGCAKDTIDLTYGPESATPLAINALPAVMVRMHTLDSISITTRANCTAKTTLRRYAFAYTADGDTQQPRLQSVVVYGRDGMPEASTPLPVATYQYGAASSGGVLKFEENALIAVPHPSGIGRSLGASAEASLGLPGTGQDYATSQVLADITGDGLPDLVYEDNSLLWVAKSIPAPNGAPTFASPSPVGDSPVLVQGPVGASKMTKQRFSDELGSENREDVWRQLVDINGDGRLDIIDASIHAGQWTVYLNTPSNGPTGVQWRVRAIPTATLRNRLATYGHTFTDVDHLPLARHYTAREYWTDPDLGSLLERRDEYTYTEWELKDINGDGLPDFIFDTLPVQMQVFAATVPFRTFTFDVIEHLPMPGPGANSIEAMFNVAGITLDGPTAAPLREAFSAPAVLIENTACGIEMWQEDSERIYISDTYHRLRCTLADVTGDGIVDRVDRGIAYLGLGGGFSHIQIPLPADAVGQHFSGQRHQCVGQPPDYTFQSFIIGGLRDVTGDGIADLLVRRSDDSGTDAYVGTGFGFRATPLSIGGFVNLSTQYERCDGGGSTTFTGLFDLDGDGRAENDSFDLDGNIHVRALAGGSVPGIPEAGLLTAIDNGYGATTRITYGSAKRDATTAHSLPFPEIVVTSVETHRTTETAADTLAKTRYAYGDAALSYDPRASAFVFSGYRRMVSLRTYGQDAIKAVGQATVTDTLGLAPYTGGSNAQRYARIALMGAPSATTVLSGTLGSDPSSLLALDVATDQRQTARTTYTLATSLFEEPVPAGESWLDCLDYPDPYDYDASLNPALAGFDTCAAHGFSYAATTVANRGAPQPSTANVQTRTRVLGVDPYGRLTQVAYDNDVYRSDDDVCLDTTYATPTGSGAPILIAPATRRLWDCKVNKTYRYDSYEYDGLAVGKVAGGRETGHVLERHATDTGAMQGTPIRVFDGTYDALGNLVHSISVRDDGVYRENAYTYDPFGLVAIKSETSGTNLPTLTTRIQVDPYTLDPVAVIDPNGTQRGVIYDGFERMTHTTVAAPDGTAGVFSSTKYIGFAGGAQRTIVTTTFDTPVSPSEVDSATGHTSTVVLDELGRETREELGLGADYAGQVVVKKYLTYDPLGQIAFSADPFVSTTSPQTAYGTSYHYNPDGSPNCFVRASGAHALTAASNSASETFPECFYHGYANHLETLGTSDADANLAVGPQAGTLRIELVTAVGRLVSRSTSRAGVTLEYSTYAEDPIGYLATETRYKTPTTAQNPVTTRWRHDSYGNLLSQQDPEGQLTSYVFDSWGEPTQIAWTDTTATPAVDRRIVSTYDAYGRLVHHEERNANVADPESINDYAYDKGQQVSPEVTPTNLLGRLARAASPTSTSYFSYDIYGVPNATTWIADDGRRYVQKLAQTKTGTLTGTDFYLPDNNYQAEHVAFSHDSAGRLRAAAYTTASTSTTLFEVGGYDEIGRVRKASYGKAALTAAYATSGRGLLQQTNVSTPTGMRETVVDSYDPIGRELHRYEKRTGVGDIDATHAYDAIGRLRAEVTSGVAAASWTYSYDALGNLAAATDSTSGTATTLAYRTVDEDQACKVGYPIPTGNGCNVTHDYFGNVTQMPTPTGTRSLDFFLSGHVKRATNNQTTATFRYDAFGALQDLLVEGAGNDNRRQRSYGSFIEAYTSKDASYVARSIPAPAGVVVTLRAPNAEPQYAFGEARGVRFTTDSEGAFLQDLAYQPFGGAKSLGAAPGSPQYTTAQWNGGDALASLGLSILGDRLYDPMIGRFLGRDPLHVPRTAATTNPYAFAINDPVNHRDPSGRDWQDGCLGAECQWLQWFNWVGGGGGGGGGAGGGGGSHGPGTPGRPAPPTAPPMTGKTGAACEFPDGASSCGDDMWPRFRQPHWYERAGRTIASGWMKGTGYIDRGLNAALDFFDEHETVILEGAAVAVVAFTNPEVVILDAITNGTAAFAGLLASEEPGIAEVPAVVSEGAAVESAVVDEAATSEYVNLASPQRTIHILDGDATGGAHAFPGGPGKTPFPASWSDDRIMHEVSDIATDPNLTWARSDGLSSMFYKSGAPATFTVIGERGGILIKVVIRPMGEGIITAHPVP